MTIASVLQTALTGMSAAQITTQVVANNMANCLTDGFKASIPRLATQAPATLNPGASPNARVGGRNPVQIGNGVQVVEIVTDVSQGTIAITSDPMSVALQGDGFFIVEGPGGERLFTRNGGFQVNRAGQVVTESGHRVLGAGVDENFQIHDGELSALEIHVGQTAPTESGAAASLVDYHIGEDGRIRGQFSDGVVRDLGQIRVARFTNPSGLEHRGQNLFAAGPNSGLPVESSPGSRGAASLVAGATELSNTDIGQGLIDLILASVQFRANAQVVRTSDQILEDLVNLRR